MRYWPWSIRLIHWGLALVIILDTFFVEDEAHRYLGYAGAGLIILRLFLGFTLKAKIPEPRNKMALTVYFLIWTDVIALAVTGWMLGLDAYFGDEQIETIHTQLSNFLIALVIIHLIGMVLDAIRNQRKTWMGMISGKA